ncbi:hypothetical protein ACFQX9_30080 [Bradyrhizobium sp. GCM10028915]|uniref:hypothetical protein n=1 Tax=Bradyrhizobium sp. GCM10028915 TaxID=3273385 RepID=UPI0036145348
MAAEKSASERIREHGELAARTIISLWKGPGLADACHAALQLGHLNSANMLPYHRCRELLDREVELHKVNEDNRTDVSSIFHQGRDTIIPRSEVWSRYFPAVVADNDNEEPDQAPTSGDDLSELTNPGGVVSELIDWIVSSSSRPSRELALSAVLPFVGALLGRRFASQTDLRTNFYTVALADSGYGKDHARTQLKRLITAAGLDRFSGPNRFMSASALRSSVLAKPSCLCMVDEFGGMMRQINDPRAGIHSVLIRSDLLEMFTSASTFFEGAAYAKEAPQKIHNPNLCIYGTSTPDDFWASVSSLNTADGLLPRFMLFNVTGPKPNRVEPSRSVDDVPKTLIEAVQALAMAGRSAGNLSHNDHGSSAGKPVTVRYSVDAAAELEGFQAVIEATRPTKGTAPILNRAAEHAIKLALTVSVAGRHEDITGPAMKWAVQLAWLSTCTMIEETADRISDNQREADRNRIFGHIKRAGSEGITTGRIADRCASIDRKRREELLSDMVLAGRIETKITATKGRPQARYYPA